MKKKFERSSEINDKTEHKTFAAAQGRDWRGGVTAFDGPGCTSK